ncbi:dihydroorotate dehydrogenase [Natranaerobius trueperi]|uniref:Dihydroorotate dehydrogenase n=1 Tax=Natranaerobius trueperi TaxID=759412 RepID=A0A226BYB3_9FIRM|nr:dihydroorotate dehydrogenase [Natranaerobius trueperi]OWZ83189.1 dihydroorotate dehydrogenase B catalytic subunit [Natranaerobius trueperi]
MNNCVDLRVNFAGINMKNPVAVASGTFGFGTEYQPVVDPSDLGAVVVKGLTLEPRDGNTGTRLYETPSGLLNSIGLMNPGVDYFIDNILETLKQRDINVIVNISGNKLEEYARLAEKLSKCENIKGLEINVSCPNVKKGGLAFGVDPELTFDVVNTVKDNTDLPIITKLTPNVTDIKTIARACEQGGTSALSLINTLKGMAISLDSKKPVFDNEVAGLSGPAIKPIALRCVFEVSQVVNVPIMGLGGISNVNDAIEMIIAGASAIAVGTANFMNPTVSKEIIEGLEKYCIDEGITDIEELVGLSHRNN